jgi:hypothetical protein
MHGFVTSQSLEAVLYDQFLTLDFRDFGIIRARMRENFFKPVLQFVVLLLKLPDVRIKGHFKPPLHFCDIAMGARFAPSVQLHLHQNAVLARFACVNDFSTGTTPNERLR